jgi:transcriptional regulator with XRE-family HTH domain
MLNNLKKIRLEKKMSVVQVARLSGDKETDRLTRDAIYKIEKGEVGLNEKNLAKLSKALGVPPLEIMGGKASFVPLRFYKNIFDIVNFVSLDKINTYEVLSFDTAFLMSLNVVGDYENTFLISIKGDNMHSTYKNGDLVFINKTRTEIVNSNIYLINEDGGLQIRRIRKDLYNNTIDIISDNPNKELYPTQHILLNGNKKPNIIGTVLAGAGENRI